MENIVTMDCNAISSALKNTALKNKEARKLEVISSKAEIKLPDEKIQMPTYKVLAIKSLGIAKYQREPKRSKYKKIAQNLDMDVLGVPLVSHRKEGKFEYWIIDGQNRCRALELCGVQNVLCQVIEGLTVEQEAEKYLKLNTERTSLNANQKFMGKLGRNDIVAIDIVKILERNGFSYATNTGLKEQNRVACLSSCEAIYRDILHVEFENIFKIIRRVWDGSSASLHVQIIRGLGGFIKYHVEYYDIDILVAALSQCKPENILDESVGMDDRMGKRNNWADKSNFIYVSKLIWAKYEKYCKENSVKRIPWMFD